MRKVIVLFVLLALLAPAGASDLDWPEPTRENRPGCYWWWLGSAVDKENLTWNLETLDKAGIGGVTLVPIYGVKGQEDQFIPYISSSSITDLYYICRKAGIEKQFFLNYLKDLLAIFEVLIIDKVSINDAISSDIKDFEDAVQILACKREHIDLIITRDKKDFKNPWIKVQTPDEFLPSSME